MAVMAGGTERDAAYLRDLLEHSADVVFHSVEGVVQWISPSVREVMGYAPEDIVGRDVHDLWHPDDVATMLEVREAALAGTTIRNTLRLRTVDGTYRWIESSLRPYPSPDGSRGIIGSMRDVTDVVLSARALAASEERFRRAVTDSAVAIGVLDGEGRVQEANEAFCRIFGYDEQALEGMSWADITHPDDLDVDADIVAEVVAGTRGSFRSMRRCLRADDTVIHGDVTVSAVRGDDGVIDCFVAQIVDITGETIAQQAAETSEERYRLLAEHATDVVVEGDADGIIRWVSPSVEQVLGWRVDDLLGTPVIDLLVPDDRARALAQRPVIDRGQEVKGGEGRYRTADGGYRWMSVRVQGILGEDGRFRAGVLGLRDIDAEVAAREALLDRAELLRAVLDSSPDMIVRIDRDRTIRYVNRTTTALTGRATQEWLGQTIHDVGWPAEYVEQWEGHLDDVFTTGTGLSFEIEGVRHDGAWFEIRLAPEFALDGSVHHVVLTNRSITDRKRAEAELVESATHDALTRLANRGALLSELQRALAAGRRSGLATAVLLCDLDHFKNVNDSLGHHVGDGLLRVAAARIASTVREADLVARHGGDEFVVVIRDVDDATEALRAAERLVVSFRQPIVVDDAELFATASVGIAIADPSDDSDLETGADDLLREADTAMYVAKENGRDRAELFNEELRARVDERLRLENELRPALERDEFVLHYQPEIDLQSGTLRAVEALLRWHHPDGRLLTADHFIGVAESSGLILDIGDWVIREACAQAARWADDCNEDRCPPLTVRINLSALQLSEPALILAVDDALRDSGVDPALLCVELTETALLRDLSTVRHNLEAIRKRGIRIAIDDFGTGYASLAYLREFPVDVLKIDRSFISTITTDSFDHQLVAGIVAFAHRLGIPVTAEGVETPEQAELLYGLGCEGAQGWLYSKAVPAAEISAMRREEKQRPNSA